MCWYSVCRRNLCAPTERREAISSNVLRLAAPFGLNCFIIDRFAPLFRDGAADFGRLFRLLELPPLPAVSLNVSRREFFHFFLFTNFFGFASILSQPCQLADRGLWIGFKRLLLEVLEFFVCLILERDCLKLFLLAVFITCTTLPSICGAEQSNPIRYSSTVESF